MLEYDIFQKTLFCTLVSSMNLGLDAVPVAAGQYLWKDFTLSTKNTSFYGFQCIFKQVKTKMEIFRQS